MLFFISIVPSAISNVYVRAKRACTSEASVHERSEGEARAKRGRRRCSSAAEAGQRGSLRGHHRSECEEGALLRRKRASEVNNGPRAKIGGLLCGRNRLAQRVRRGCSSAAEAGCFARGLSGGDPPNPPCCRPRAPSPPPRG
jgi:hypothetical protein